VRAEDRTLLEGRAAVILDAYPMAGLQATGA
jgi:hypothetical protein